MASTKKKYTENISPCLRELVKYKRGDKDNILPVKITLYTKLYNRMKDETVHDSSGLLHVLIANSFNELAEKCGIYYHRRYQWDYRCIQGALDESIQSKLAKRHDKEEMARIIGNYFPLI